jgi:D-alanyl-D-alanine carboxypeptidase
MTQKAHELGMMSTTYRNASGLPNPAQVTTARDLVKLALALYRDFPKEYAYFATEEFTYNGATYTNHNHLMRAFEGMDGIKTGYIRASGFNLAASAVRDNRRLIGVVMGGQSAHARDMEMAHLLNDGFAGRNAAPEVATAETDDETGNSNTLARRAVHTIARLSPVGRAEAATTAAATPAHHGRDRGERWSIQVGAFAQEAAAEKAAATALAKLPVKGKTAHIVAPGHTDKERYFRARIVSFSEGEAEKACRALKRRHLQCAVVAPSASQQLAAN